MNNPLLDKDFLKQLDSKRNRIVYAQVISLTKDEEIREDITGRITSGSISIDGSSCTRRTCSLSLAANNLHINEFYWSLKEKFKLMIGIENTINSNYPDIIWFKMGIYVITSFTTSQNLNSYTININGIDKMALLNGTLGGTITSLTWDFGKYQQLDENGDVESSEDYDIKEIITYAVHEFAGEPFYNIILNDIPDYALRMLTYSSADNNDTWYALLNDDNSVYALVLSKKNSDTDKYKYTLYTSDDVIGEEFNTRESNDEFNVQVSGESISIDNNNIIYNNLIDLKEDNIKPTEVMYNDSTYTIAKFENGSAIGYSPTTLSYATSLIANVGEAVTSILDKIKSQLGDYEYFYDLDGHFVFQKKRSAIYTGFDSRFNVSENYIENAEYSSSFSYSFDNSDLVVSYNNTPNISDLKNDYAIWGTRTGVSGNSLTIHMRYAIDEKPVYYKNFEGVIYYTDECIYELNSDNINLVDWREIIYQMAVDYNKYNRDTNFEYNIKMNNIVNDTYLYPNGKTGYEQYYKDMYSFWRKNLYYYDEDNKEWKWRDVWTDIDTMNFWFDFIDTDGDLGKYSVKTIGDRAKAVNDNDVKAIYYRNTLNVIFYSEDEDKDKKTGYTYIKLNENDQLWNSFIGTNQGKSAYEVLQSYLNQYSNCAQSISITTVPVYYLEPNTRISLYDSNSDVNGEYVIDKISINLGSSSTMSISGSKYYENLY